MDWLSTIVGALIGFLSSLGIIVAERMIARFGRIKVFVKMVHDRSFGNITWGFQDMGDGVFLYVPMWIELQNLSDATRVIRDVNLILYNDDVRVAEMRQINRSLRDGNEFLYANNGSYSFSLEPRCVVQYECEFVLRRDEHVECFNKIKLRYFDEKGKEVIFNLGSVDGNWEVGEFNNLGNWKELF